MAGNKTIKKLMGLGCQRNDAAAFARVYRKLMQTGNQDMFPGIVETVMPVRITKERLDVRELRAVTCVDSLAMRRINDDHLAERIKDDLADQITEGLKKIDAIKFQTRTPNMGRSKFIEYMATLKVVMPGEV